MSKILIVDDRPVNRELLVTLLNYRGDSVAEASDGTEGLAEARLFRPDLVIADIIMPTMDGYEFVRQIRADPVLAATKVIFYTASGLEPAARDLAEACGVACILAKPCDPEEILAAVGEALGGEGTPVVPAMSAAFASEHLCLVTNRLSVKVDELEALNAGLEARVVERTAELAAANEELRGLNRLKDEFLAVVSHDLRSPLSGIEMMSGVLRGRSRMVSPAEFDRNMETIGEAAHHLLALVNDLLDIAKIEAGHAQLDLTELHIHEVLHESAKALRFNAQAKGVVLAVEAENGEPPMWGDRLKLSQVFSNLLNNAIKFTPAGGTVRARVAHGSGGVAITVADTGRGIPAAALPLIFDKFSEAHRAGTSGERGTGLGLSIVRRLVELHGGGIEVASEVGHGSTFTVRLPFTSSTREVVRSDPQNTRDSYSGCPAQLTHS